MIDVGADEHEGWVCGGRGGGREGGLRRRRWRMRREQLQFPRFPAVTKVTISPDVTRCGSPPRHRRLPGLRDRSRMGDHGWLGDPFGLGDVLQWRHVSKLGRRV